jgi:hypothetical protein
MTTLGSHDKDILSPLGELDLILLFQLSSSKTGVTLITKKIINSQKHFLSPEIFVGNFLHDFSDQSLPADSDCRKLDVLDRQRGRRHVRGHRARLKIHNLIFFK